jgi:octaprenyl-diphosphate synthase
LFESAGRLGAILADAGPATEQALADYGLNLGIAFQIVDDMLDYTVDAEEMGKNAGDDLAEGKATLPLIHALGECAPDQHQLLSSAISEGHRDWLIEVKAIIESTSALAYTSRRARDYAEAAKQSLETLPASPYRTALADLADFSVSRTY